MQGRKDYKQRGLEQVACPGKDIQKADPVLGFGGSGELLPQSLLLGGQEDIPGGDGIEDGHTHGLKIPGVRQRGLLAPLLG